MEKIFFYHDELLFIKPFLEYLKKGFSLAFLRECTIGLCDASLEEGVEFEDEISKKKKYLKGFPDELIKNCVLFETYIRNISSSRKEILLAAFLVILKNLDNKKRT